MILVCKQSVDGARNDEALLYHQAFPNLAARLGGRRLLLLLVTDRKGGHVPFLFGQSSLQSFFLLSVPLAATLEADAKDPPCCCCLGAATAFLTNTLCLSASISAKERNRCYRKGKERWSGVDKKFRTYVNGRRRVIDRLQVTVRDHLKMREGCLR